MIKFLNAVDVYFKKKKNVFSVCFANVVPNTQEREKKMQKLSTKISYLLIYVIILSSLISIYFTNIDENIKADACYLVNRYSCIFLLSINFVSIFIEVIKKKKNKDKNKLNILDKEIESICIHEAGHAVLSYILEPEYFVESICNFDNTCQGSSISRKCNLLYKKNLINRISILYAGIAAEKEVLGYVSNGFIGNNISGESDYYKAENIIKQLNVLYNEKFPLNKKEDLEVQKETDRISRDCYQYVSNIIKDNAEAVKCVASILKKDGKISNAQMKDISIQYCIY